jgi:hypothetical protein
MEEAKKDNAMVLCDHIMDGQLVNFLRQVVRKLQSSIYLAGKIVSVTHFALALFLAAKKKSAVSVSASSPSSPTEALGNRIHPSFFMTPPLPACKKEKNTQDKSARLYFYYAE